MDAKLKVVGGNKAGVEIPLKKAKFVIGRSPECSLRAGSDAISRRHCEIRMTPAKISILDLGSRNGTFVNGERVEGKVDLNSGDEVSVGPLTFQVMVQHGLDTQKRPEGKDIADAAARTAQKGRSERNDYEDDITEWLTAPASDSRMMNETTTMRLDETNSVPTANDNNESADAEAAADGNDSDEDEPESASSNRTKKSKPGKLPPVPKSKSAKDSCEAAAEVLRSMTRRR